MDRRLFLVATGGAMLSTSVLARRKQAKLRIGIIGGGIVGAAIAMQCARAGASVTLLEKTTPAAGATSKSFAWINPFSYDAHYTALRLAAYQRWRELDHPLGLGVTWGGYVDFTDKPAERGRFDGPARLLAAAGYPTRSLDLAALKQISPELVPGALAEATWSDISGHVDPVHATNCYLAAAKAAGAEIRYPCRAEVIEPAHAGQVVVTTPRGRLTFDRLVVAAGVDAPALLTPLGYTPALIYQPGALAHSRPLPPLTRPVIVGLGGELSWKQMSDGRIVGAEASVPPNIPAHAGIRAHPMEFPPGIGEMHGVRIFSKISTYMPPIRKAELDFMTIGLRPVPSDRMPIVGPVPGVPGVSVCVTHSGVTLSPLLGDYVAAEVIDGREQKMLAPYRPGRSMPSAANPLYS